MKIHIENNLYLESDGMQFVLRKYSGKKGMNRGREVDLFTTVGYFSNVASAINHIAKMKIMQSQAETFQELLNEMKEIRNYIESTVRF